MIIEGGGNIHEDDPDIAIFFIVEEKDWAYCEGCLHQFERGQLVSRAVWLFHNVVCFHIYITRLVKNGAVQPYPKESDLRPGWVYIDG